MVADVCLARVAVLQYDHADMALAFGHPNATWIEVKQLFTELRSSGLRLHYWP